MKEQSSIPIYGDIARGLNGWGVGGCSVVQPSWMAQSMGRRNKYLSEKKSDFCMMIHSFRQRTM